MQSYVVCIYDNDHIEVFTTDEYKLDVSEEDKNWNKAFNVEAVSYAHAAYLAGKIDD